MKSKFPGLISAPVVTMTFSFLTGGKDEPEDNSRLLESFNVFSGFIQSAICNLQFEMMKDVILKIYLQPRSSKNEIVGPYRDGIKVKVTAPPVDGKANEALIRFLSKALGIPPSQFEIIKGQRSREKTLSISGINNWVDLPNSHPLSYGFK